MRFSMAFILLVFLSSPFFLQVFSQTTNTINATQSLKDGEVLVSDHGRFELAFFSLGNSRKRYVGIRYGDSGAGSLVWVANRQTPLNDSSGIITFSPRGDLIILDESNTTIWSSNSSQTLTNPVAQVLDTGNHVIRDGNDQNPTNYLWQSFDHIGNTLLPNVKIYINLVTGQENYLTTWRSEDDPSLGEFKFKIDPNGVPQFFLRRGLVDWFRGGPWNGIRFSGLPIQTKNTVCRFEFAFDEREIFYRYQIINDSIISRVLLAPNGSMHRFNLVKHTRDWVLYSSAMVDSCDRYATCGPHATCTIQGFSPICRCLRGYVPRDLRSWELGDWSSGCTRSVLLQCLEGEDFVKYIGVKLPDTRKSWYNRTMSLKECRAACLRNCSCTAYANLDIRDGGSGCIHWFNDLVDIRVYDDADFKQDFYMRMAASEIGAHRNSKKRRHILKIIIPLCVGVAILLGIFLTLLILRRRKLKKGGNLLLISEIVE